MNHAIPEPLLALWLAEEAVRRGGVLVHVARSDARAARLLGPAQVFAGEAAEVLPLPGWDVLPYDPARPSTRPVHPPPSSASASAPCSALRDPAPGPGSC